jgi:hypothetical protein
MCSVASSTNITRSQHDDLHIRAPQALLALALAPIPEQKVAQGGPAS